MSAGPRDDREGYSCVLAGATGLVGAALLRQLLADPNTRTVTVLVRRPLDAAATAGLEAMRSKLRIIVASFDDIDLAMQDVEADIVYCALGTTIKAAGSQEAFRTVDLEYPLALARYAKRVNASQFAVITAMGSSKSSAFFYSRVKGELEEELAKLEIPLLHIFQPSLLLGHRKEKRLGETVGTWLATALGFTMVGRLRRYRAIRGDVVAAAMLRATRIAWAEQHGQGQNRTVQRSPEVKVYASGDIAELGHIQAR
ncbi:NAD(P)H-binding protein [Paenibacillus sp. 2TAB19]|uniref:NAD(P)H-binding protein n=1 Tax=Paenibacillus sp. 2TAB19 TaxID=3233003 RepID=UPI003F983EE4